MQTAKKKSKELIYGCMHLGGGWDDTPITPEDERIAETAVYTALESGIRIFDHADIYTRGKAQIVFGRLLKRDTDLRKKIIIQSKTGIVLGGHQGGNIYNLNKQYIIQQVEKILEQLQTDHLDVLLLHRPDVLMQPEVLAETFAELQAAGLVKEFGASNMAAYQIHAIRHFWKSPFITNQIQLSLNHANVLWNHANVNTQNQIPNDADDLIHDAIMEGYTIQAWGALDRGKFTTGIQDTHTESEKQTIHFIHQLSEKYASNPHAIVLAWLFKIPGNIQPVIGSTKRERIAAASDSLRIELTHEEWYRLWLTAIDKKLP